MNPPETSEEKEQQVFGKPEADVNAGNTPRQNTLSVDSTTPLHVISLGAGVQSSAMALMALHGSLTPQPDCAIFADTQAEPGSVYRWLDYLDSKLEGVFPIYRVTAGDLAAISTTPKQSEKSSLPYLPHTIPAYTVNENGTKGQMWRVCTDKQKLQPIRRKAIEIATGRRIIMWIGISLDEAHRMKASNHGQIENRYPLIEKRLSRHDCLRWMQERGYPAPPRSSCVFCPYHSDREWLRLKRDEPDAFAAAVAYERQLQSATTLIPRLTGVPFLHNSRQPLDTVDFRDGEGPSLFGNECEGLCGV